MITAKSILDQMGFDPTSEAKLAEGLNLPTFPKTIQVLKEEDQEAMEKVLSKLEETGQIIRYSDGTVIRMI